MPLPASGGRLPRTETSILLTYPSTWNNPNCLSGLIVYFSSSMEAFSATSAIRKLFGMLSRFGNERISLLLGLEDETKKLENDLETVVSVLEDAEEKQVSNKSVLRWLQDLKDFAYDVEDIFDEFQTEAAIDPRVMCPDDATATKKSAKLRAVIGTERLNILRRCGHIG